MCACVRVCVCACAEHNTTRSQQFLPSILFARRRRRSYAIYMKIITLGGSMYFHEDDRVTVEAQSRWILLLHLPLYIPIRLYIIIIIIVRL